MNNQRELPPTYAKYADMAQENNREYQKTKADNIANGLKDNHAFFHAQQKLNDIVTEFEQVRKDEINASAKNAFRCVGDKSEYLSVVNEAKNMSSGDRMKYAQSAMKIDAWDNVRAIASTAFDMKDFKTLDYISQNSPMGVAQPLSDLAKTYKGLGSESAERNFRMFNFFVQR